MLDGSAEFGRLGENGEEWLPIAAGDVVNVPNWAYHGFAIPALQRRESN